MVENNKQVNSTEDKKVKVKRSPMNLVLMVIIGISLSGILVLTGMTLLTALFSNLIALILLLIVSVGLGFFLANLISTKLIK